MRILVVMLVTLLALGFLPSEVVAKPLPPRPKPPAWRVVMQSCVCVTAERTWPCEVQGKLLICRP